MNPVQTLSHIVQIPSVSGEEEKLAHYLYKLCIKLNLPVEKQDKNIVIKFISGSKKCLIFNAHLDTVKPGDLEVWKFPPLGTGSGVIEDGKLYGLGASDDKAGIAALLGLASELNDKKPPTDIFFVFPIKEETNSEGSKSFVKYFIENYKPLYNNIAAIIAEPTDLEYIELGYRSRAVIKITTSGDSGHAARPEEVKEHAIYNMIKTIKKINTLEMKLQSKAFDKILGSPTLTLTVIQSLEGSLNQIPSKCSSFWDVRVTPKIEKNILPLFEKAVGKDIAVEMVISPGGCVKVDPEEKIVKIFQQIIPNIKMQAAKGSNDCGCFIREGIPAITFGPGHKSVIHKENEYAIVENINKAIAL